MQDETEQIQPGASIEDASQLPQFAGPLARIRKNKNPKKSNKPEAPLSYKSDWLESLKRYDTVPLTGIGLVLLIGYIWNNGLSNPTEYFITTVISLVALIVVVVQAYFNKRQWFGMRKGLENTEALLEQNERMIEAVKIQGQHAKTQADLTDKQLAAMRETTLQAREQFLMTNKPVMILTDHLLQIEGGTFTGPVQVSLKMTNTGNGIANNVSVRVHRAFLDKAQSDFVEKGAQPTGDIGEFVNKGIVGNGGVIEHVTKPIDNQDGATFYVWGEIMYDDAFSDPTTYITFFCLSAQDGDKKLAYCRHWNKIGQLAKPDLSKILNRLPIPNNTSGGETDQ